MTEGDLNLLYLKAEIQQIDVKVQRLLRLMLKAGRDQTDRFQGLHLSVQDVQNIAGLNPESDTPQVSQADETLLVQKFADAQAESQAILHQADQAGIRLRLLHLRAFFDLTDFEYQAFMVCLLPALDLRYERIYSFLQDDITKKGASVDLILTLLETDITPLGLLSSNGTLVRYRLLRAVNGSNPWQEPRLNQLFEVSPALVSWLVSEYFPEEPWLHLRTCPQMEHDLEGSRFAQTFDLNWQQIYDTAPLLAFDGPDEQRQELAAKKTALSFDQPLLKVNLREACAQHSFDLSMLRLLIRDACLLEAVLYIQGWELVLDEDGFVPPDVLQEMANFAGFFVLGSQTSWRISRAGGRPVQQVHFSQLTSGERAELWQQALGSEAQLEEETLRLLSGQFVLTSAQIENAVFTVKNLAEQSGKQVSTQDLFLAARQQSNHHLAQLAQKIEPRYSWQDIVLPENELETLHDIISMMRYRPLVLEEWGLGKKLAANHGLSALFTGESGTGKTLAAQVIASELQLDLYRIDLSNVVSKYIGETEKNLEKIFQEAHNSNTILFFDEADALFGKRSEVKDAHDRYANIEVGYLLQRMETHDGITILATNLSANMDDAFTRRLNFIVHFPFPDETQRLAIWKVLLPPTLPLESDIDWGFLARNYALAGGNIRNVLVAAAFLAAQNNQNVRMEHLLQSIRREMQKMGRFIKEEDYVYPVKNR